MFHRHEKRIDPAATSLFDKLGVKDRDIVCTAFDFRPSREHPGMARIPRVWAGAGPHPVLRPPIMSGTWTPIGRAFFGYNPGCKVYISRSMGVEKINFEAAAEAGCQIVPIGDYCGDTIAAWCRERVLRNVRLVRLSLSDGPQSTLSQGSHWQEDVRVAVVGTGRIGNHMLEACARSGLRTEVLHHNDPPEKYRDVFAQCTHISLHLPATKEVAGLIDDDKLRACRPGTVLINTAKPEITDGAAIKAALDDGRLGMAYLDVGPKELETHPRCVYTQYESYRTPESLLKKLEMFKGHVGDAIKKLGL